jgi:hypothetical protein
MHLLLVQPRDEALLPALFHCGRSPFAPNAKIRPIGARVSELQAFDRNAVFEVCEHAEVREIGEDIDGNGKPLTLVRCQQCGLLICEYSPTDQDSSSQAGHK